MNLRNRLFSVGALAALGIAGIGFLTGPHPVIAGNPVEVGAVKWGRDLDAGLQESKASGKPVLILFQEVPGCSGCQAFGRDVLSQPTVVRHIEAQFVPVLIHNNKPGKDAEVLKKFGEPAWNFQVVRFLDAQGRDIIPRKDQVWTVPALAGRMVEALQKAGRPVPEELKKSASAKAQSSNSDNKNGGKTQRVAFSQYCFWTGECALGAIPGVLRTEAGFFDGHEVTLVDYDPDSISLEKLAAEARKARVADGLYVADASQLSVAKGAGFSRAGTLSTQYRPAPVSDQKKQIQGTAFESLKLSPEQATKVNAFARTNPQEALRYLSPAQQRDVAGR